RPCHPQRHELQPIIHFPPGRNSAIFPPRTHHLSLSDMPQSLTLLPDRAEQAAELMAWTHESPDWHPLLTATQQNYAALAAAIAREVPPIILCQDEAHRALILQQLGDRCQHQPHLLIAPYNDTWCRDYGPITLGAAGKVQMLDFCFNGWGDKYDAG